MTPWEAHGRRLQAPCNTQTVTYGWWSGSWPPAPASNAGWWVEPLVCVYGAAVRYHLAGGFRERRNYQSTTWTMYCNSGYFRSGEWRGQVFRVRRTSRIPRLCTRRWRHLHVPSCTFLLHLLLLLLIVVGRMPQLLQLRVQLRWHLVRGSQSQRLLLHVQHPTGHSRQQSRLLARCGHLHVDVPGRLVGHVCVSHVQHVGRQLDGQRNRVQSVQHPHGLQRHQPHARGWCRHLLVVVRVR